MMILMQELFKQINSVSRWVTKTLEAVVVGVDARDIYEKKKYKLETTW